MAINFTILKPEDNEFLPDYIRRQYIHFLEENSDLPWDTVEVLHAQITDIMSKIENYSKDVGNEANHPKVVKILCDAISETTSKSKIDFGIHEKIASMRMCILTFLKRNNITCFPPEDFQVGEKTLHAYRIPDHEMSFSEFLESSCVHILEKYPEHSQILIDYFRNLQSILSVIVPGLAKERDVSELVYHSFFIGNFGLPSVLASAVLDIRNACMKILEEDRIKDLSFDKPTEFSKAILTQVNYLINTGCYEEAYACVHRVLEADPNNAAARESLAIVLTAMGRLEEALHIVYQCHCSEPQNTDILVYLATLLDIMGRSDEAIEFCERIFLIEPNHAKARDLRIQILHRRMAANAAYN